MTLWVVLVALALALALWMTLAWAVVLRSGRSGFADAFWSSGVGVAGVAAALVPVEGAELTLHNVVVAVLVGFWALRLGSHILRRTLRGGDDPRYAELKRQWGDAYPQQLLLFLLIQAGAGFVLAVSVLAVANTAQPTVWLDLLAVLVAVAGIGGEAVSDRQLRRFTSDPGNKGKVCDTGLWALSRHPNYVFEWLFWVGIAVFGLTLPPSLSWLGLAAPVMMYVLLRHVSGVPPLEAHMRRSRGAAFRKYAERVPPFWPRLISSEHAAD